MEITKILRKKKVKRMRTGIRKWDEEEEEEDLQLFIEAAF